MPVEADIFKRNMALRSKGPLGNLKKEAPEDQEDANDYVGPMKSREREESGTVDASLVEPEPFVVELRPFDTLESHECGPHQGGKEHPAGAGLPFLNRYLGEMIDKGTTDQDDSVDTRQELGHWGKLDPVTKVRWPGTCSLPEHEVGSDQSTEKQRLGTEENAHPEFASCRWSRRGGMMIMLGNLRNHGRVKEGRVVKGGVIHR